MGMHFEVTGINPQPFIAEVIDEYSQQRFSGALVAPAAKAPVRNIQKTALRKSVNYLGRYHPKNLFTIS
jgi:hypothetical protein